GRLIKEIKETLRKIPNKGTGYGILKYLAPAVSESNTGPAFEVKPRFSFNYLGQFDADVPRTGLRPARESAGVTRNPNEQRHYQLAVSGMIAANRLTINIEYSKKQFRSGTIETLSSHFQSRLLKVIEFCASREKREFTPSDFTYPHLSIETVDRLNSRYHHAIRDIYLLTPMQQGILFHALKDKTSEAYFEQFGYRLHGVLDPRIAENSLNELFKRHDVLRTAFVHREVEEPLQLVFRERSVDFYYEDISRTGGSREKEQFIDNFKAKDRRRPFRLSKDVLMRASVLKVGDSEYEFIWSSHHILMDGWCAGILISEFMEIYTGLLERRAHRLPPVTPYRTYIQWLGKQKSENSGHYWETLLDSYEETVEPPGKIPPQKNPPQANLQYKNETLGLEFDPETGVRLNTLAAANNVTMNSIIQAIWAILLGRYNGKGDIVFGSVVSGRPAELKGVETIIGLFINTIPVRIRFQGDTSFKQLIRQVQARAIDGMPHHYYPLAKIQSQSLLKQELINHIMVFENFAQVDRIKGYENRTQSSLTLSQVETFEQTNYDFNLTVQAAGRLTIRFGFNGNVFDSNIVRSIGDHFRRVVDQVVANEAVAVDHLTLLSDPEKHRLLVEFNDTQAAYPSHKVIHQLFEEQVERTPDRIALEMESRCLTFNQLNRRSSQLARVLLQNGVEQGSIVGVSLPPSLQSITALFAVLKAGGAFLNLDPSYPQERIDFMLRDSGAKIIVTDGLKVSRLDGLTVKKTNPGDANAIPNQQTNHAYLIYTSGSTGMPKGVLGLHKGMVNRFNWMWNAWPFKSNDVCCQKTSLNFVDCLWEIFGPLLKGVPLVIIPEDVVIDLPVFVRILKTRQVTRIVLVPGLLYRFFDAESGYYKELSHLTFWVTSGEALQPGFPALFREAAPQSTLLNLYGSSEISADVTCYNTTDNNRGKEDRLSNVPIGRPIDNTQIYILDETRSPAPIGIAGEIYAGGAGLASGYLNQPELTAERFVALPAKSAIIYKTGDLGRWLEDGTIEYLGRKDRQVKIRGFRVEMGEIEEQLRLHPGIKEAVVMDRQDNGRQYLCAYVVPLDRELQTLEDLKLKEYLKGKLPEYMVPAYFVELGAMPLTAGGKVHRKQLPGPSESGFHTGGNYEAPGTGLQQVIADTWKEVLGREKIGITHNFFDLGGNSLDFIRISAILEQKLDRMIPVATLFTYPTIQSLELFLTGGDQEEKEPLDITPGDSGMVDVGKDLMRRSLRNIDEED
ncbi:MAG: amino acid adenylation domain-containing protein, partial [bacterium]|nr:amino acid adenylation domain-containing protein [bacterium]